jgi:hypothetical protein
MESYYNQPTTELLLPVNFSAIANADDMNYPFKLILTRPVRITT